MNNEWLRWTTKWWWEYLLAPKAHYCDINKLRVIWCRIRCHAGLMKGYYDGMREEVYYECTKCSDREE